MIYIYIYTFSVVYLIVYRIVAIKINKSKDLVEIKFAKNLKYLTLIPFVNTLVVVVLTLLTPMEVIDYVIERRRGNADDE